MPNMFLAVVVALVTIAISSAASVREANGGNCIELKSCRPRCITFRLDRLAPLNSCKTNGGIFANEIDLNPWNINDFGTLNCLASESCINDKCDEDYREKDLLIHAGEEGYTGSFHYTSFPLARDEEAFTFCSIYTCPKDECALPEQMGSKIQFTIMEDIADADPIDDALLVLELSLKIPFVGNVLTDGEDNRVGPLHVEWMDDPTGCRGGSFSKYVPISPPSDPVVSTSSNASASICEGEEYDPAPLPQTKPPSMAPSSAPTESLQPTVEDDLTRIEESQTAALRRLYDSTRMDSENSLRFHNWFKDDAIHYCDFSGVGCDQDNYVTSIDLTNKRLSGQLPDTLRELKELRTLKLVGNSIAGPIPAQLGELTLLTMIELAANDFSGSIPSQLSTLSNLRRLMLQNNQLNGTIPTDLCNLTSLLAFDVSGNFDMHGELPSCLGTLPLEIIRVDDVGLVGEVPEELCSVRNINMLKPNLLGCHGIACPAGFYEPTFGRATESASDCLECPTPSNVIGSTSCFVVEGNTVITPAPSTSTMPSLAPTLSSAPSLSSQPSASPSVSMSPTVSPEPTQSPSSQPSKEPTTLEPSFEVLETPPPTNFSTTSAPSVSQTLMPTKLPTMPPTQTMAQTPPPSEIMFESVELQLIFAGVSSQISVASDIAKFETITEDFLNAILPSDTSVNSATVSSQSLEEPEADEPVVSQRRVQEALFVNVDVRGNTEGTGDFGQVVEEELESNFDDYVKALSNEIDLFQIMNDPDEVNDVPAGGGKRGKNVNWYLLIAAVALSVVAVIAVYVVRQYYRKDRLSPEAHYAANQTFKNEDGAFPVTPQRGGGASLSSDESSSGWHSASSAGISDEEGDLVHPPEMEDNGSLTSHPPWTLDPEIEESSTTEQTLV